MGLFPYGQILSHVRFGLISAKALAEAVEAHPLLQTKAGKAFVHEAYRYQALPPESRDDFASSMAARARPRPAVATALSNPAAATSGCSRRGRRSYSSKRGHGGGGGGGGGRLTEGEFDDDGFSSDGSEGDEGRVYVGAEGGSSRDVAGPENGGVSDGGGGGVGGGCGDGARTERSSDCAEEGGDGARGSGDEAEGVRGDPPRKALAVSAASPSRRLWGSGLRMYV